MKPQSTIRTILLISLFFLPAFAQNQYLVRAPGSAINQIANRHGLTVITSLTGSGQGLHIVRGSKSANSTQLLQSLQTDPQIQWAEHDDAVLAHPNYTGQLRPHQGKLAVNNSNNMVNYYGTYAWGAYVNQPAGNIIGLNKAHGIASGQGTVAFLDTGVDFGNPVLFTHLDSGWDFTRNFSSGSDLLDLEQSTTPILDDYTLDQSTTPILDDDGIVVDQSTTPILDGAGFELDQSTTPILDGFSKLPSVYGHGTMVAGLIHLVAPNARLMPVKVFTSTGKSSVSLIVSGIYYAVDHGAKVINMSFSFSGTSAELTNAINYANSHKVVMVAAAGNGGQNLTVYPAGYQLVMGIGSTNNSDVRSSFSNYGSAVTVAAPGEGLITTYPFNHYAAGWGTSFSAPLVSGAAALMVQIDSDINETQADQDVSNGADYIGKQLLGAGRLDLFQACQSARHN